MNGLELHAEDSMNYGLGVDEYSMAKVMEGSIWDSMTSDEIDEEAQQRITKVLEFMEKDY